MAYNSVTFAGVNVSSGRKPVTFIVLDTDLNILEHKKSSVSEFISCLIEYENILLIINSPAQKTELGISADLKKNIHQMGFVPVVKDGPRQWMETDAKKCFLVFCEGKLLSRRSFEGRIQRALILYNEGLQIPDPMDLFEEVTRHKLMQGILPLEKLHSARELDALIAAYVAWMVQNRSTQVDLSQKNFVLLKPAER